MPNLLHLRYRFFGFFVLCVLLSFWPKAKAYERYYGHSSNRCKRFPMLLYSFYFSSSFTRLLVSEACKKHTNLMIFRTTYNLTNTSFQLRHANARKDRLRYRGQPNNEEQQFSVVFQFVPHTVSFGYRRELAGGRVLIQSVLLDEYLISNFFFLFSPKSKYGIKRSCWIVHRRTQNVILW